MTANCMDNLETVFESETLGPRILICYRDGKSWGSVANFEDLKVA